MHVILLEWLAAFEKACSTEKSPTVLYNQLVMLGCERPHSHDCDCLKTILETTEQISNRQRWIKTFPSAAADFAESIQRDNENLALYISMHANHGAFNRRVHTALRDNGMLAKVRAVCLRDLRAPVKEYVDGKYHPIASETYGQRLKTFLVDNPTDWF